MMMTSTFYARKIRVEIYDMGILSLSTSHRPLVSHYHHIHLNNNGRKQRQARYREASQGLHLLGPVSRVGLPGNQISTYT